VPGAIRAPESTVGDGDAVRVEEAPGDGDTCDVTGDREADAVDEGVAVTRPEQS
jgi:hypothetical protein